MKTMENARSTLRGLDFYLSTDLWITIAVAISLCVVCVLFHYEMFSLLGRGVRRTRGRIRIVYVILGLMMVHTVEIWLFGIAYICWLKQTSALWRVCTAMCCTTMSTIPRRCTPLSVSATSCRLARSNF